MAGWISLHRKLTDNPIYSNAFMLKLWIHCLLKATHKEHNQLVGNQMVKLEPGQFVTGRNALFEEFNKGAKKDEIISAITLWRWMKNFEEWQMLNIKTTTKYSVVTITNWSEHQQYEQQVNNKRTTDEQQMNSKRTTDEQQVNTNNNVNNANNINKGNNKKPLSPKRVYDLESDEMKLVDFFVLEIRKNIPDFKDPDKQYWCDEFRKLIEIDHRDKKEIGALMRWVQKDDFEMANVLSPTKLRKRYDSLLIKMKKPKTHFGKPVKEESIPEYIAKQKADRAANNVVEDSVTPEFEEQKRELLEKLGVTE